MDSLFGVALTSILVALLVALGVIFAILGVIAWRQPLLVRMGMRNIARRKSQTVLIVIGLMLSTLIISAAFATGDTVGFSITNSVFEDFEEADFVIGFDNDLVVDREDRFLTTAFLAETREAFGADPLIDGIGGLVAETLPVINLEARLSEPEASFVGIDPADIDSFRALQTPEGETISASSLGGNRAYISEDLADEIDAGPGDTVTVLWENEPTEFEVIDIVRDTSVTGAGGDNLSGGIVTHVDAARALTGREGKFRFVAVSINGGVRDTLDDSDAVEERLEQFIEGAALELDALEGPLAGDPQGFLDALAEGRLYVAISSPASPRGEIRAQLLPDPDSESGVLLAELVGEEAVPATGSSAEGFFRYVVAGDSVYYTLRVFTDPGLDGATAARIYLGAAGENGEAVATLIERDEPFHTINLERENRTAEILFSKSELIDLAETVGSIFVTFFLIFGLFAIASGVLLIFLIFVMLAADRRSEMGMARAVGMQRLHLTESFLAEGMAYNVGSAAVGGLAGLVVAFGLVQVLATIGDDFGLAITFHFNWQGFLIAYSLGVVLTFATVAFSSFRVANLNIVRAIRDLPEPQPLRGADRSIGGLLKAALGALWFVGWLILFTVFGILGFFLFIAVISTFGVALIPGALLIGLFYFGARNASQRRMFELARGRWLVSILWLASFNVLALITLGLLRSRAWASRYRNAGGWAVVMLVSGLLLVWLAGWGLDSAFFSWWHGKAFAYTSGVTLAVLAAAMLAVYFGSGARPAFSIAGLALLWYWLLPLPFSLFADINQDSGNGLDPIDGITRILGLPRPTEIDGNVEMFFVSGIAMTACAVLVIIFNAETALAPVRWLGRLLGGIGPAIKTAIAYPLAAKFRTGMTLAMFGLVVFSLVVMATLNSNFTQAFLGDDASGGFDVAVDVNSNNRIPDLRETLRENGYDPDAAIEGVGRLVSAFPQARVAGAAEFDGYRLAGVDDEFLDLQQLPLDHRAIGFNSDEEVWEAIRNDPTFAVVDASRLESDDPFGDDDTDSDFVLGVTSEELREAPWQPISLTLRDPATGETIRLRVIGVLEPQVTSVIFPFFAIFTQAETVESVFGGGELEDYFIVTREPSDEAATEVARAIESTLLEVGVQADSLDKLIGDAAATSRAFQFLFEGFMALGLIVGIAALGVIAFRTVVERRQQIGMLRAIGYSRRLVAISYFLESSFIALAGIAIGVSLGVALSYNLLQSPDFTDGADVDFQVPWLRLAIIIGVAYGASALMTLLPARAASRVAVAEALRYE